MRFSVSLLLLLSSASFLSASPIPGPGPGGPGGPAGPADGPAGPGPKGPKGGPGGPKGPPAPPAPAPVTVPAPVTPTTTTIAIAGSTIATVGKDGGIVSTTIDPPTTTTAASLTSSTTTLPSSSASVAAPTNTLSDINSPTAPLSSITNTSLPPVSTSNGNGGLGGKQVVAGSATSTISPGVVVAIILLLIFFLILLIILLYRHLRAKQLATQKKEDLQNFYDRHFMFMGTYQGLKDKLGGAWSRASTRLSFMPTYSSFGNSKPSENESSNGSGPRRNMRSFMLFNNEKEEVDVISVAPSPVLVAAPVPNYRASSLLRKGSFLSFGDGNSAKNFFGRGSVIRAPPVMLVAGFDENGLLNASPASAATITFPQPLAYTRITEEPTGAAPFLVRPSLGRGRSSSRSSSVSRSINYSSGSD